MPPSFFYFFLFSQQKQEEVPFCLSQYAFRHSACLFVTLSVRWTLVQRQRSRHQTLSQQAALNFFLSVIQSRGLKGNDSQKSSAVSFIHCQHTHTDYTQILRLIQMYPVQQSTNRSKRLWRGYCTAISHQNTDTHCKAEQDSKNWYLTTIFRLHPRRNHCRLRFFIQSSFKLLDLFWLVPLINMFLQDLYFEYPLWCVPFCEDPAGTRLSN